jgi:GNAT superfamily N-acetyltransferase
MNIEPCAEQHTEAVVQLSLRAWAPVFASIEGVMDPEVYRRLHPDWREGQRRAVEAVCADAEAKVWVALEDGAVVGFVAAKVHAVGGLGEIYMVAVDPAYQRRGIGTALAEQAIDWMKGAGASVAMVETGGDPGHAPARRAYEKLGFGLLPVARYFRKL